MRENVLIKIVYVYLTKAKHFHSLRGNSNAIKNFNENIFIEVFDI